MRMESVQAACIKDAALPVLIWSPVGTGALTPTLICTGTLTLLFDLEVVSLQDTGALAVSRLLQHRNCPQRVELAQNKIGSRGVVKLARALADNPTLRLLDLSSNHCGDEGTEALAAALAQNTALQELSLQDNWIGGWLRATAGDVALSKIKLALEANRQNRLALETEAEGASRREDL